MLGRNGNLRPFLCALPLINIFLFTLSLVNSDGQRQYSEEDIIKIRTTEIKENLYNALHFNEENRYLDDSDEPTDLSKLPPEILDDMQRSDAEHEAEESVKFSFKKLIVQGDELESCITSKHVTGCYHFDLSDKRPSAGVASAQIWFYKNPDVNDIGGQKIRLMEVIEKKSRHRPAVSARNNRYPSGVVEVKLLAHHETRKREGWIKVDIKMDSRWTKQVMVAIQCKTCHNRQHKSLFGHEDGFKPLLVLYYDETTSTVSRPRRMVDDVCDPENDCCRKEIDIDFKHIMGLERISSPKTLSVGYCHGVCRSGEYTNDRTALTQTAPLYNPKSNQTTDPELVPCCVPIRMQTRSFLLIKERSNLVSTQLENAAVLTCGCV